MYSETFGKEYRLVSAVRTDKCGRRNEQFSNKQKHTRVCEVAMRAKAIPFGHWISWRSCTPLIMFCRPSLNFRSMATANNCFPFVRSSCQLRYSFNFQGPCWLNSSSSTDPYQPDGMCLVVSWTIHPVRTTWMLKMRRTQLSSTGRARF